MTFKWHKKEIRNGTNAWKEIRCKHLMNVEVEHKSRKLSVHIFAVGLEEDH